MGRTHAAALLLATTMLGAAPGASAEWTASWTLAELHQSLVDAQNSEDKLNALLATKVYDAMRNRGVRFVNNDIVFSVSAPGFRTGVGGYRTDPANLHLLDVVNMVSPIKSINDCSVPLPSYALLAVESPGAGFSAQLYGDETFFFGRGSPGSLQFGVYAVGKLSADASVGLVWGGSYPVPGTEYRCDIPVPPYPCGSLLHPKVCTTVCGWVPTVTLECQEWTDSAGLKAQAEFSSSVVATLTTSFSAANRSIILHKNVSLSGEVYSFAGTNSDLPPFSVTGAMVPYVTPDLTALSPPSPSSPLSSQIMAQTVGLPIAADAAVIGSLGPLAPAAAYLQAQLGTLYGLSLVGVEQQYVRDAYQEFIAKQNAAYDEAGYNDPIVLELPVDVNDQILQDVLALLHNMGLTDFLTDFVRSNLHEILYYILTNDRAALEDMFAGAAACKAVEGFAAKMPVVPLYARNGAGACVQADVNGVDMGRYYTDAGCLTEVAYRPTSFTAYCNVALATTPNALLGNAAAWSPDLSQPNDVAPGNPSRKWTQWPGVRLPLPAEPIGTNHAPYMKQVRYRDVVSAGHTATCALEMRIYKKDVAAQNRPALLALHGGSWTYRGAAFTAFETTISHYTERGFVVFAPFYRLTGQNDGDAACNNAQWQEVTADAEAALDWVKTYGGLYGASKGKIALTGQSAGGHLSGWLVTHRPDDVSAALVHYPPADVLDFIANAHVGGSYEAWMPSLGILNGFYGTDVAQVDVTNPPEFVLQNSFAQLVQTSTQPLPPMFILHGVADSLVPSNQSVMLCNAYGGSAQNSGGGAALRAIYGCGSGGGELHLFQEGEHGLDACVTSGLCLSGSTASAALVADSDRRGRDWLYARTELPLVLQVANVKASGGSGGANVMDGNAATVWTGRAGQYLQMDLGVVRPVGGVGIVWGGRSAGAFKVTTSADGVHWAQAFSGGGGGSTRKLQISPFGTVDARYVRLVSQSGTRRSPVHIGELRLYGPVAPRALATAPVQLGFAASLKSRWDEWRGNRSWSEYDLGVASNIAHVVLTASHDRKLEIQFSVDGKEWTRAGVVRGSGHLRLMDFQETTARYVRVGRPGEGDGDGHDHGHGDRHDKGKGDGGQDHHGHGSPADDVPIVVYGVTP